MKNPLHTDGCRLGVRDGSTELGPRMRKERPTMRIEADEIKAIGNGERDGAWPIPAGVELAPIRCTMPVPCGHCWYCLQSKVDGGFVVGGEVYKPKVAK